MTTETCDRRYARHSIFMTQFHKNTETQIKAKQLPHRRHPGRQGRHQTLSLYCVPASRPAQATTMKTTRKTEEERQRQARTVLHMFTTADSYQRLSAKLYLFYYILSLSNSELFPFSNQIFPHIFYSNFTICFHSTFIPIELYIFFLIIFIQSLYLPCLIHIYLFIISRPRKLFCDTVPSVTSYISAYYF